MTIALVRQPEASGRVDIGEFGKAEAGLTCLSVLVAG